MQSSQKRLEFRPQFLLRELFALVTHQTSKSVKCALSLACRPGEAQS